MVRVFYASFPINRKSSTKNLSEIAASWIASGSFRNTDAKELVGIYDDGFILEKSNISVKSVKYETKETELYGVRLIEKTDGKRTTDIVGQISPGMFNVSISHDYQGAKEGDICKTLSMPRISSELIKKLGGDYDGDSLIVSAKPRFIKEKEVEAIAQVIKNGTKNKLPVIYLSKDNSGKNLITNHSHLAQTLAGMAHVLIEPSVAFSFKLKELTNGRNAYRGAIGIYWPNGKAEFIVQGKVKPDAERELELCEMIRKPSLYVFVPEEHEFDGICSLKAQKRIIQLNEECSQSKSQIGKLNEECSQSKSQLGQLSQEYNQSKEQLKKEQKNSKEISDLLDVSEQDCKRKEELFELACEDSKRKDERIKRLIEQNIKLTQTNASLSYKKQPEAGDLLKNPRINPLYDGELEDIATDALNHYKAYLPDNSRRRYIVNSLTEANSQTGKISHIREEVKKICKGYRKYSESWANGLRNLGFTVKHERKHIKISVEGEDDIFVTIPATSGCQNVGNEICSDILNLLL